MPPVARTDFPYPLRTIDGEVDVIADSILSTTLDVTGDTNLGNLYVSGFTTVVGGIIDLADIQCDTINCINAARMRSTLQVDGVSTLYGGVATTAINCDNLTASNNVTCANCNLGTANASTITTSGGVSVLSTDNALSPTSGSIVTQGGIGVQKDVYTAGNITSNQLIVGNQLVAVGGTGTTLTINSDKDATTVSDGAVVISGGAGVAKNLVVGGNSKTSGSSTIDGVLIVNLNTAASSTSTGSIISSGGLGLAKNIVAGDKIKSELNENATTVGTGAIVASNGGISCQQDLVVGGIVKSQSLNLISKNALDTTSGTTLRLNGTGDFTDVNISNLTTLNFKPFTYSHGVFTPQLKCLEDIGGGVLQQNDWANVTNITYREGYFQRVGNLVTVWYNCQTVIDGAGNDFASVIKIPTITNLPYSCGISFFSRLQDTTWAVTDPSFPNGYALGVGAPSVPLMPYPYEATVLTKNFPFVPQIPPAYVTTLQWTSDGKTIVFSGDQLSQFVGSIFWEAPGNIYNFHVLSTGSYTLRFNGMAQYFTDA